MKLTTGTRIDKETAEKIKELKQFFKESFEAFKGETDEQARWMILDAISNMKAEFYLNTGLNIDQDTIEVTQDDGDKSLFHINATMELPPGTKVFTDEEGNKTIIFPDSDFVIK
jgi:hypothetical protein